ncbi:MAG TPA: tetratricopeptide repeat protein [Humisphaera sp.]|jgi:predicted O-linked N-acetylglucosamine transferase (SPINDLY family)|nr:tetratricopeptide repeat protein [Humisphaera sp.]
MAGPNDQQLFVAATQHHRAGRLAEAEAIYRDLLSRNPNQPDLLHMIGVLALHRGEPAQSIELIGRAIAIHPTEASYHGNLGLALNALGQSDQAIAAFGRAIELRSDYPEAHYNLGIALRGKGRTDEAATAFTRAASLKPDYYDAWFQLGATLRETRDFAAALNAMQKAAQLQPESADAHAGLGSALRDVGRLDDAIAAFHKAIALRPNDPHLLFTLGSAYLARGQLDEASEALRAAIGLKPDYGEAYANLGQVLKEAGQPAEAIDAFRQSLALRPDANIASNIPFTMQFLPDVDDRTIAAELARWNQTYAQPLGALIRPLANDREPRRQLRIGYVSPDFRNHSVGRFMLPLLSGHARGAFQIYCYSDARKPDAFTALLASKTKNWRATARLTDEQLAAQIRDDKIDILVDLALHTSQNRLLAFAQKPAPVQVTYLAYCGTSGMPTMDYRLTDPYLDPPGREQTWYSEKSIRLPKTYWCYQPPDDAPAVGPLPAQTRGNIAFGCLNNFCKISPPALRTWIRILQAIPNSRLHLHAFEGSHRDRLREELSQAGIDSSRVEFSGYLTLDAYYNLYNQIDITLDPFPYAGGTSTCDSLWMGAPVVTLAGERAISRGGVSILSNTGITELIAQSPQDYAMIATSLARDPARLSELRSTMRQRMGSSPLMDAKQFTSDVEAAYRQMWQEWCETL